MRKARGNIYEAPGIFHLESSLHADRPRFTTSQVELYETWLRALTQIYGFDLLFWQFHPTGFSFIVETSKTATQSKIRLANGLATIGEDRLSNHVSAPEENTLLASDTFRLDRFLKHYQSMNEFAKGLKQRISRQHNQSNNTRGSIWADRMRVYRLPSRTHDLTEVAAFILASPEIYDQEKSHDWPGSYRSAVNEDGLALRGLKRIFQNRHTNTENLQSLSERSAQIIQTIQNAQKRPQDRRRRQPEWRPNCETAEYLKDTDYQIEPKSRNDTVELAKQQFIKMFERFKDFQKKTGYKAIPHGYQDDIQLRTWASSQRGLFHSGRLTQWKIEMVQDSGLLDPPTSSVRNISSDGIPIIPPQWMARYEALKSFYQEHGHSKIVRTDKTHKALAYWVWTQRAKRRKAQLLPKQIQLLDDLEFCWNPRSGK
ncbi:helicase associated domain-containing protein [Coraliomargarita parva]|uniref:helicase associated domain-containing protein n=1 Tax=Coraliomargarita parva TaxID=3014050 RepID=UPI0022B521BF|nr:helicase associated domain-containing protein [Coraliomargarita parva]